MIKKLLHIISIIFALLLLISYLTAYIPPSLYPKFSLFGFLYPVLLAINIGFIILWLFLKWTYIILPLAVILIRVDYIPSLYRLNGQSHIEVKEDRELKILSYNVCSFHYKTEYNEPKDKRIEEIFEYIKKENPDVLALQDYNSLKKGNKAIHRRIVNELGLEHYFIANNSSKYLFGNAIYSRYPINKSGTLFPLKENNNAYIFADIEFEGREIRVYNFHLTSFKLADKEKETFESLKKGEIKKDESKNILKKLIWANDKRSKEVDEIIPILSETKIPYFVVGDFNDTPFSYTYRKLITNMKDAFEKKGRGFGSTYNGVFPAYRIDYILYSDKDFEVKSFEKQDLDYSDHYPISSVFEVKEVK